MKLVYFYIQSYGCLQDRGFLFDVRYSVSMVKEGNGIKISIKKTGDNLDNILYGNVSFTAIVGDNGAGKSTSLDALQAWLVDFDNNPGFVILEDGDKLFFMSAPECKLHIDENGMKLQEYKDKQLLFPLNAIFFSDVLDDRIEMHEISEEIRYEKGHVQLYRDISTRAKYDIIQKKRIPYPLRELQMKDSLLQIQLVEHFSTNYYDYPWSGVNGEKYLFFQIINIRYLKQRYGMELVRYEFDPTDISYKIIRYLSKKRLFNAEDIIRETLFCDYILCIYKVASVNRKPNSAENRNESLEITLQTIKILFSDYWDDKQENIFLENVFCRFNQDKNENNEKAINDMYYLGDLGLPSFELYVNLYLQIKKMPWIVKGFTENRGVIHNLIRGVTPINSIISIAIPEGESIQTLYSEYMEAQTYIDFLKFTWLMSSGEKSICLLFARLYDVIKNIRLKDVKENSYLIMIDEIDNLYHPKWQQKIVNWIAQFLNTVFPLNKFQVIITTHSPVLLSDIPENRVIFIPKNEKYENEIQKHNETFAANIATLYYDAFFMHEGSIGEMAKITVDMLYEVLSNKMDEEQDDVDNRIIRRYVIPQTPKDIIYNQDVLFVKMSSILKRRYSSNYINKMSIDGNNAAEIVSQLIDIVGEDIWREQLRVMYNKYFTLGNPKEMVTYRIRKLLSQYSSQEKDAILKGILENDSNN